MPNARRDPRHEGVFSITLPSKRTLCELTVFNDNKIPRIALKWSKNTTQLATIYAVPNRSCTAVFRSNHPASRNNDSCYVAMCVCGVAVWIRLVRVYCRNSTETVNGNQPFSQFVQNSAGTSYLPLNMILWRKRDCEQMQLCCYATAYRDIGDGGGRGKAPIVGGGARWIIHARLKRTRKQGEFCVFHKLTFCKRCNDAKCIGNWKKILSLNFF